MKRLPPYAWVRLAILLAVVGWLSYGPVRAQALGMRAPVWSKTWRMYGGTGRGLCDVDYWHRTADGDLPLDRYAALDIENPWKAPRAVRFVERPSGVVDVAHRLCRTLPPNARDVRADARCAAASGVWEVRFSREDNLCTAEPIVRRKEP